MSKVEQTREQTDEREEILITAQVRDLLTAAVEDSYVDGDETGGSLLSHEDEAGTILVYALPPGPAPDRGPLHVRTDARYQGAALARVLRRCPGLRYAGDWHIHPMWLPELSATDRATALAILRGECRERGRVLLLLGTWQPGRGPVLLGFSGRMGAQGALAITELTLRVIGPRDDDELRRRLGTRLPDLEEALGGPEPEPVAHGGAERIRRDLEEIRQALGAQADLWAGDEGLHARLRLRARHAVVLFPPEYPHGAPLVFAGTPRLSLEPIPLPYGWSTAHRLLDPVSEALSPPLARALRRTRGPLRRMASWLRAALVTLPEELP
jgi:proteasome lid subunit RPN8/RPN11